MLYKNIVFDIDGTLLDTEYAVLHSMQDTLASLWGKELPLSELKSALGITGVGRKPFISGTVNMTVCVQKMPEFILPWLYGAAIPMQ